MAEDIKLDNLEFLRQPILARLNDLEIHTIRQLFARLQSQEEDLANYLELSDEDFAELHKKVNEVIKERFPEELLPRIYPAVNKRGVAVHRLNDSSRPRFFGRK